mgnify:CR=1 FL=1
MEIWYSILAMICLLFGLIGAGGGIVYSRDGARSGEFAAGIMLVSALWALGMILLAARLLGFGA